MPAFGSRFGKTGQWWADRSRLEQILMVAVFVVIFLIVVLLLTGYRCSPESPEACTSSSCLREASKILEQVNSTVNPCDDFYQFTCGNFLKTATGDDTLSLEEYGRQRLLEIYTEKISDDEHKMVKAAKKLFQGCMDEMKIERDGLKTIKEVLDALGGWPVVERSAWNEDNFDWVQATYKLRELGYHFRVFMEVSLRDDPETVDEYIFEVTPPDMMDYRYYFLDLDKVELMADVAQIFGAVQRDQIMKEMEEAHKFYETLKASSHPHYENSSYGKFTVRNYQQQVGSFRWLEFINKIVGPSAAISEDESVMFALPEHLSRWLSIISETPKRTQANYMIWKVIEEVISYLKTELSRGKSGVVKRQTREEFCLTQIEARFIPSPAGLISDRRRVPLEKRKQAQELLLNIKSELLERLHKVTWMEEEDKQITAEKIKALTLITVRLGNYFEDTVLNDMDVDMVETKSDTFLSLIAQANRNLETAIYNHIHDTQSEAYRGKWLIRDQAGPPIYDAAENTLFIPAAIIQNSFFNEKRPQYINYGAMGALAAYHFTDVLNKLFKGRDIQGHRLEEWSNSTKEEYKQKIKCLEDQMSEYKEQSVIYTKSTFLTQQTIGQEISYSAYDSWVKKNGEESPLIATPYTSKQMFWIAAASTFCHSTPPFDFTAKLFQDPSFVSKIVSVSLSNDPEFARDFNCPAGSRMNPTNRCFIV